MFHLSKTVLVLTMLLISGFAWSQNNDKTTDSQTEDKEQEKTALEQLSLTGLKFRGVGPAITSGRISDFAVNPDNPKEYYVAVSSGGVWKTKNAGNTFKPLFDGQKSYSIGCVTLDPQNPNVVWVGSGENNNQRSVAYGDGVYKSNDGGASWKNMGLKESEHIGSIVVHPDNSNMVYVAAIGPLWKEGGDRGVYRTRDGGETWDLILEVDEHTGANELHMDPRDPQTLYASMHQRRRHVFTYVGGGEGSGIYKSIDGGDTWQKINKGLPSVDLGRIGLSVSPVDPDYLYAIVEAAQGKSGFYRSTNRGASWHKRGSYSSSGNYYQEIIADLTDRDKIYAMNTWMQVSIDGGKTFKPVGEDYKHVDNHCMWIDPQDEDHWLVGCDGGIYETWDAAANWDFKANLPVTQFYKVAVDQAKPFYNIYGGTQDNFSLGGPSRTISGNGIANDEWFITHGGDGFESQVDPDNPNIVYAQSQHGVLVRYDKNTGEEIGIQPKPGEGEDQYRWNWDAPLQVSNHVPGRLYFAANKLFRSDDRGHSWQTISGDLTAQIDRNALEVMGKVQSVDAVMKNGSTSQFGTIVAFSESPLDPELLFVGTDDGLIQVSKDGGASWHKIDKVEGAPEMSYVNELLASQHDASTIYVAFNHHKYGDFKPYIFRSTDAGKSWKSIAANLPKRGSIYAIAEDHVDPNLLFVGTEFGVFFTMDGGQEWKQLKVGLPTIAVRDIAIHRGENDLILGTFGRGFYVLDDYSPLRSLDEDWMASEGDLLPVRDAKQWEWSHPYGLPGKSFQGDNFYMGDNLGPVALFRYYLKEKPESLEDLRRKKKEGDYPSYDELLAEEIEEEAQLTFTVRDSKERIVRKIITKPKQGLQQVNWDLRYAPKDPISLSSSSFYNPFSGKREGHAVAPGTYHVDLMLEDKGKSKTIGQRQTFRVQAIGEHSIPAESPADLVDFKQRVASLHAAVQSVGRGMSDLGSEMKHVSKALEMMEDGSEGLSAKVKTIEEEIRILRQALYGDRIASRLDLARPPSISSRIGGVVYALKYASSSPTATQREQYALAREAFSAVAEDYKKLVMGSVEDLRQALRDAGAPYTPNALPPVLDLHF